MKTFKTKFIEMDEAFFLTLEQTDNVDKAVEMFKAFKTTQDTQDDLTDKINAYIESEEIVTPITDDERNCFDVDDGFWYKVDPDTRTNLFRE